MKISSAENVLLRWHVYMYVNIDIRVYIYLVKVACVYVCVY
jgi:hypothetical protein